MDDTLIISGTAFGLDVNASCIGVDEVLELQYVEAESIGWWPLGEDAYLHAADDRPGVYAPVINIVGLPQDASEGIPTLLLV